MLLNIRISVLPARQGGGGYFLSWPKWEGSAKKGYLFQASGICKERGVGISLVEVYETVGKYV